MTQHLGDFAEDATVDFKWSTNDAAGASITRATNGTVSVYIGNGTTQLTAGVTDTEDFDSLTGIHHCRIDLSADAGYATGSECQVVLSAATINGQTVNAVLASFSIERSGGALALLKGANGVAAIKTAVDGVPTATENADALLNRDMSAVSDTNARSPLNALRFLRNKWDVAAGTLTVTKEDDTTQAWTAAVTTDAAADPVIGNNPA